MRTLTIRHAMAAAAVATVAMAAAGCGSAATQRTASGADSGSTTTSTANAAQSPSPAPAAGSSNPPPSAPASPVVPTGPTRQPVPHVSTSAVTPLPVDPSRTPVPAPPGAVTVTTLQNGGTVHVAVGGTLSLVGFPSNWQPQTSDASVVTNPPLPVDPIHCQNPPGVPCPLPPLNYKALAKGTVKLTAHRTQCGEARPCVPPESYDYALTVVVD